ncbi:MAG: S9 family peptidase [Candidatus Schekmanbacteria bacterium]|nr:S9 family peptidase [Candidatus Schekmanbacteria bacterium]
MTKIAPTPPLAEIRPEVTTIHGESRLDEYSWMRDRNAAIPYLEAENAYAREATAPLADLEEQLFSELRARLADNDGSAPVKRGHYVYYWKTRVGQRYKVHCRRLEADAAASEEVILDENELARDQEFMALAFVKVSPNHCLVAFAVDTTGYECYTIRVKDLRTGGLLADEIAGAAETFAWNGAGSGFYYGLRDDSNRIDRLMYHELGAPVASDRLVYREPDPIFDVDVQTSRDGLYDFLIIAGMNTMEIRFRPTATPEAEFHVLLPRRTRIWGSAEHHRGHFYVLTNLNAPDGVLLRSPVETCARASAWVPVATAGAGESLSAFDLFSSYLVLYMRRNGRQLIRIIALDNGDAQHEIRFPEALFAVTREENPDFDATRLRVAYSSLKTPPTLYEYDMAERALGVIKSTPMPGYDPAAYELHSLSALAADDTPIPLSVIHRQGVDLLGKNPVLLTAYGAYGVSYEPRFSSDWPSLLDRGVVVAIAHVRGGGELGDAWYRQGTYLAKKTTFADLISCAEHLLATGIAAKGKLALQGRSAGGLLTGAVACVRPDLFTVIVSEVPFVDVLTAMLDPTVPLTTTTYEEWGNPSEDPRVYDYIKSYSPYENVGQRAYPHMMVLAGLNDYRVQYWQPAKWVARLRARKTDDNQLIFRTNMEAGHRGSSDRMASLRERAAVQAFVLHHLGATGQ